MLTAKDHSFKTHNHGGVVEVQSISNFVILGPHA